MIRLRLAAAVVLMFVGGAIAQHPTPMEKSMNMKMMVSPDDSTSTKGYKSAMMKMMQEMPNFTGDADVDFMKQMRAHHQAAIDMATVVVANGKDAEAKKLAHEIITAQEAEIAVIDAWLKKKGK